MPARRELFVISDLHIGGRYPAGDAEPGDRGFRMNTHVGELAAFIAGLAARASRDDIELVINGDFVDFLAEESPATGEFLPFVDDPHEAARRLATICDRDAGIFDALASLSRAGGRITILLGNHDLELSLPEVRAQLLARLGADDGAGRVHFVYDGEAYVVGDALIEHGNRYDGFNAVDHDALRRLRSLQSRRQPIPDGQFFTPPPGSRIVSSLMNPIKRDYPFVDLLKPETQTVIPILLALEPDLRRSALDLIGLARESRAHAPVAPAQPAWSGDIAAMGAPGGELADALAGTMGEDAARRFAASLEGDEVGQDISSFGDAGYWGIARLFTARASKPLERRLPALLEALRGARGHQAFDPHVETTKAYLDAATALVDGGFRYVIFGHSHLAKEIDLGAGRKYLNTGTWADLIRFPDAILDPEKGNPLDALRAFIADLVERRFDRWITWSPTYAHLVLEGDRITSAGIVRHSPSSAR